MNILDNIKDTLLSVPKGITTGIKSLSTQEQEGEITAEPAASGSLAHEIKKTTVAVEGPNYDAGAELLSKFQNAWSDMHQKSEVNAKQAKLADKKINELSAYFEKQNNAVSLFLQEISSLPQLLHDLKIATELIQNLEQQFEVVESELMKLEDMCERQELQRNMRHHEYQLMAYRQRRAVELEQAKVKMAKNHASKIQRHEYNLQKGLREKQQAFEASFKEEMSHYKKYGKPSRYFQVQKTTSSKEVDLSNFAPEPDVEAEAILNEFLQTGVPSERDITENVTGDGTECSNLDAVETSTAVVTGQQQLDDNIMSADHVAGEGIKETAANACKPITEQHEEGSLEAKDADEECIEQQGIP